MRERSYMAGAMAGHRHDNCLHREREEREATLSDYCMGVVTWLYMYKANGMNAGNGHT